MKVVQTDNYGGDYPIERVVFSKLTRKAAEIEAAKLNASEGYNSPEYYKVVPEDYVLSEGFKP